MQEHQSRSHKVRSLTQSAIESREATDEDSIWFDDKLKREVDEGQCVDSDTPTVKNSRNPFKRARAWWSLETGEADDDAWYKKSRVTDSQKAHFNSLQNNDEFMTERSWFYKLSVAMFGLAAFSILATMVMSQQIQGGWNIPWSWPIFGVAIAVVLIVWFVTWWVIRDRKSGNKWAVYGSLLIALSVLMMTMAGAAFAAQLLGLGV